MTTQENLSENYPETRKSYFSPAIIQELDLETRADSPLGLPDPFHLDGLNPYITTNSESFVYDNLRHESRIDNGFYASGLFNPKYFKVIRGVNLAHLPARIID